MITFAVVFIFLTITWFYYKWKNKDIFRLAAGLRGPSIYKLGIKLLGTHEKIMEAIIDFSENYGPDPYKVWLGSIFFVVITRPEDIQIVLNSSMALQKNKIYDFFKDIVGESIFTAPIHKWQRHRRLISPLFNSNTIRKYLHIFIENSETLVRHLKKEVNNPQPFDLWDYISPVAFDTICESTVGHNLGTQSSNKSEFTRSLLKTCELETKRITRPWLYPKIIFSIYLRLTGQHEYFNTIRELPNEIIKEKRRIITESKKDNNANATHINNEEKKNLHLFLDKLLRLNDIEADFSDNEIRDEVLNIIFAGSDTNAVATCYCLLMLAIHPDIQDKVYNEIYDVFGDSDRIITIEDIAKLVYVEQVLLETLRLYPIVPIIFRDLQDDIKIVSGDLTLPKGISCIINVIGNHHMPELYPNPLNFNPDNFEPENVAKRHKYSLVAFSGGPRGCLGNKYAMMLMKVLVSTFLRNFSIHTELKLCDVKLKMDLLMRSSRGYPVTIQPRNRIPK